MSVGRSTLTLLACVALSLVGALPVVAQQTTGTPGSPSATSTIDGRQIPPPPASFGGTINLDALNSTPYWQPQVVPPKGAPNILLIITDDVGFAAPSTFGGVIPTPTLDRIANMGLRYTQFQTTSLCSPTRAALITGRNHHSVGFGVISEASTGYPGYNSVITKDKATIGQILKANGYATSWYGKNHNTPSFVTSQAGPFDQWPAGMGFEYFYGFNGGETNQWQPDLYRNTTRIYPYVGHPNYNLTTDMADEAISYSEEAVPPLLRAGRHACAASPDAGVDRKVQGQVRHGLECSARPDFRQPEEARRHPSGCRAHAVAHRSPQELG
jgi:arylsulfatase